MTNNPERKETIPTVSAVLPDGRLVELVYAPSEKQTAFAVCAGTAIEIMRDVRLDDGTTYVPISPRNNLIQHEVVVLPERAEAFESPVTLAHEIEEYIDQYLDLSPSFRKVASAYILLSWVYDAFNEVPYLRFRGDFGTGKTRALTVVGSLLNKGFFASGASTVSPIFHILDKFRGSLILDEADFRFSDEKAELSKILNNGNVDGFPVLRQTVNIRKEFDPKAFQVFGPKIIGARQSFEDAALESRFLTEDMGLRPVRRGIPLNLPKRQKSEARSLRNKLLTYRFQYRSLVAIDEGQTSESRSARTNQIIVPLLSVAPTTEHQDAIAQFAGDLEVDVKTDRATSLDAALLEVVVALSAVNPGESIPVSAIASAFAVKVGTDSDRVITPRYTGFLLRKRLRLRTHRAHGVYSIPNSEQPKVQFLASRFGID